MENHVEEFATLPRPASDGLSDVSTARDVDRIPKDLEHALPSDPFELLRISRAIALQACAAQIQGLQEENGRLQAAHSSKDESVAQLEARVEQLQASLREAQEKLGMAEEEQAKLATEKTALVTMVKKLNRDVAKLETFKRTLMQQLQDEGDEDHSGGGGALGGGTAAAAVAAAAAAAAGGASIGSASLPALDQSRGVDSALTSGLSSISVGPTPSGARADESDSDPVVPLSKSSLKGKSQFRTPSMTPSIFSPAYTPSATPPHSSAAASPRTSKPARPRVDGKEFFRQARGRLSYEQFSTFLANIKELNAHRQTREDTLKKADEIFGPDNKDLYAQFESLLSRHAPS